MAAVAYPIANMFVGATWAGAAQAATAAGALASGAGALKAAGQVPKMSGISPGNITDILNARSQQASASTRNRLNKMRGRASTILSSPFASKANVSRTTLLG